MMLTLAAAPKHGGPWLGRRLVSRCGILTPVQPTGAIMTTPVHDLAAEVLDLPAEDRARMLELLIASFEPKSNAQKAWMSLALRRREEVRSGKVAMVPGDEA